MARRPKHYNMLYFIKYINVSSSLIFLISSCFLFQCGWEQLFAIMMPEVSWQFYGPWRVRNKLIDRKPGRWGWFSNWIRPEAAKPSAVITRLHFMGQCSYVFLIGVRRSQPIFISQPPELRSPWAKLAYAGHYFISLSIKWTVLVRSNKEFLRCLQFETCLSCWVLSLW